MAVHNLFYLKAREVKWQMMPHTASQYTHRRIGKWSRNGHGPVLEGHLFWKQTSTVQLFPFDYLKLNFRKHLKSLKNISLSRKAHSHYLLTFDAKLNRTKKNPNKKTVRLWRVFRVLVVTCCNWQFGLLPNTAITTLKTWEKKLSSKECGSLWPKCVLGLQSLFLRSYTMLKFVMFVM